jgi:hypothetical protein
LLGAFIVWQLVFLVVINFLDMVNSAREEMKDKDYTEGVERVFPSWPTKEGHFHDLADIADRVTRRYAQLTGQTQGWSLFAPEVGRQCVFPAVVVRWDTDPPAAAQVPPKLAPAARDFGLLAAMNPFNAAALQAARAAPPAPIPAAAPAPAPARPPVTVLSDNEPRDVNSFFRLGLFRVRRLEGNIAPVLRQAEGETAAQAADRWRGRITKLLNENGDVVQAYLHWRWESYHKAHPDAPAPKQLILVMRRYEIVPPQEAPPYWKGPFTEPVARLRPEVRGADGEPRLEKYNPVTKRFEEVAR